jgi:uncharacterized membrane protein
MKSKILAYGKRRYAIDYSRIIITLLVLIIAPVILYYLWTRGFVYFKYAKEVYTDYFWFRAPWLLVHIICGIVATLIGPFQFIPRLREKYPVLHRNMGKTYLGAVTLSTFVSFYLVTTAQLGVAYAVGLAMLGVVWLGSAAMAYFAIRNGNVVMHKEWMIKSYVLTLSFIGFRLVEDILTNMNIGSFVERKVLMAWACWAIPLFITEVILQTRKMNRA